MFLMQTNGYTSYCGKNYYFIPIEKTIDYYIDFRCLIIMRIK